MDSNKMLEAALAYAAEGKHVFPILPGRKDPACDGGFKAATTDPEQIRAWWGNGLADCNIGWYLHAEGKCAVDLEREYTNGLDLPATLTVRTPSGGYHKVYAGQIPSTQKKLDPNVDTRGKGGYTLLPPSMIDERDPKAAKDPTRRGPYTWDDENQWVDDVPPWVVEKLAKPQEGPRPRVDGDIDTPERIARVRELAAAAPPATNLGTSDGTGTSNGETIELINRLLDLCSHDVVFEAMVDLWMPRCIGEWTEKWVRDKVDSFKPDKSGNIPGRGSDIGCETYPIEYGYKPDQAKEQPEAKADENPFAAWGSPASFANRPEPTFWDPATKMLPRDDAEGATVFVYGQQSAGKTNVTLTWLLDIVAAGGKAFYAAGEGVTGVAKDRLPAHCTARQISMDDLTGKFAMLPCVPLLQDKNQVAQFIAAIKPFAPNVVVIDTLATATAGMDENNSLFSSLLTANGAVGQIRRAFKATVIILAHEGKTDGKGIRGHSGLMGNVDAMLQVVSPRKHFITVTVTKMRDGDMGGNHYYLTERDTVPVPRLVDAKVYADAYKNAPVSQTLDDMKLQGVVINMAIMYATQDVVPVGGGYVNGSGAPIKLTMARKAGEKVTKLAKGSGPFVAAVSTEMGVDVPEIRIVEMLLQCEREMYLHYHKADNNLRKRAGYHPGTNTWAEIEEAAE